MLPLFLSACGGGGGDTGTGSTTETDSVNTISETQNTGGSENTGSSENSDPIEILPGGDAPPGMSEFISRMYKYGKMWGSYLQTESDAKLRIYQAYYDSARTFYQIAKFTGQNTPWIGYAKTARDVIANDYYIPNNYKPAGWWLFSHGLEMDWRVSNNANSLTDVLMLHNNLAGIAPKTEKWNRQMYSRPVAYNLENHMVAERLGQARVVEEVEFLVSMALGHIKAWTTGEYIDVNPDDQHVQAFMTGLTASALIEYYERSVILGNPDTRIPKAIKVLADWLWKNMWVADVGGTAGAWNDKGGTGYGAFRFRHGKTNASPNPAPMVAQMIVPMYGFLYKHNCDAVYRAKADLIFEGGVALVTHFSKGKFFNQQHRTVFTYLDWRKEGIKAGCK